MRVRAGLCAGLLLAACGSASDETPTVRMTVEAALPVAALPVAAEVVITPLSEQAEEKIAEIRAIIDRNSLYRLSRLAEAEPSFISNFSGESHRGHWDLMRRTGFDPLAKLGVLFDGPYATKTVGDEIWYIWPDLAALESRELLPERLSFADRARLLELVGETGIERIRSGQAYPGVRTALSEDGRWLYFVHETEDEIAED